MNKSERVNFVLLKLAELYPNPPIPLSHKDPYTLLIAVVLSAQCTDVRVNQITPKLFAKADNPYSMLKLSLEALPSVGHKTASVIMAQAFNVPTFPVDTHIHRLAQRWGLSSGKNVSVTERDLKRLFPIRDWHELHLKIIFYGREHCTARGCDGRVCEICRTLYPNRKHAFKARKS